MRFFTAAFLMCAAPALAQTPAPAPSSQAPPEPVSATTPLPAQIELNLINLPTTQSIAAH